MLYIKKTNTEEKSEGRLYKIVLGSVFSVIISLTMLLLLAVLFTYTDIPENNISIAIIIISAISILIGSVISTNRLKSNGLISGSVVGGIYIISMYFLSSCVIGDFSIQGKSIIVIISSIMAGMLGGIVGVNIKNKP